MHEPKWCLFYDVHTMPACPDVGEGFDADAYADRIKACGVDYVVFHARCNLGMAYYNTKVGIRHYSLKDDMFGKLAEACQARGIALTAYINVGLSHEELLLHREWAIVNPEGYTYQPDRLNHFFRMMCYNTGYRDHLLEMVREVVSGYPIAGLFLDCMHEPPCIGVECIREMKERGIDWEDPVELRKFARFKRVRMAQQIADAATKIKPDLLLYFNGVAYEDQQDIGTYLEFECLPTGGWGYEQLPMMGRYMRTLGKPLLNMTGRFHKSWGDFGGIRTEASLEYDCLYGLALGMRTTIGDHFHPRGDINHAVFDLIEGIYGRLQKLEPWLDQAKPLADAAILLPEPGFDFEGGEKAVQAHSAVQGATRILCELKQQFDILSPHRSWDGYRLLVLPDHFDLNETAVKKIRKHLDQGGQILSSAWSGLDPDQKDFVFKEWGLQFNAESPYDPAYLLVGPQLSQGMPNMPVTLYDRGTVITPLEGTEVLATIGAPYYNRHWDGEHGFLYMPPDRPTDQAAVTLKGAVAHASHPIFTSYYHHAPIPMKQLVANLLSRLLPEPLVKTEGLPSFARVTVTSQEKRRMIHVLAYVPEKRGPNIDMIEEPIEVHDVKLALRLDGRTPKHIYLAPTQEPLPFEIQNGYIKVTIPIVKGYAMIVFEER